MRALWSAIQPTDVHVGDAEALLEVVDDEVVEVVEVEVVEVEDIVDLVDVVVVVVVVVDAVFW